MRSHKVLHGHIVRVSQHHDFVLMRELAFVTE